MPSDVGVARPQRVVIRRYDLPLTSIVVVFTAAFVAIWALGAAELPGLGGGSVLVGFLLGCYLLGPSAHLTVHPSDVVVANTFARTRIPREAIREVAGWDWDQVVIYLLDGRRIPVGALQSSLITRSPRGHRKRARVLERALRDVPGVAAGGTVQRRIRYGHALLALLTVAALGAALVWGV